MVLAAEAIAEHTCSNLFSVDGQGAEGRGLSQMERLRGLDGKLARRSSTPAPRSAMITTTTSGNPIAPRPPAAQGYEIERSFYKLDGTKFDPGKASPRTTALSSC